MNSWSESASKIQGLTINLKIKTEEQYHSHLVQRLFVHNDSHPVSVSKVR